MKKSLIFLVIIMLFSFSGIASALVDYTHLYDPEDIKVTADVNSVSWTATILPQGFNPGDQDVLSAVLKLFLKDSGDLYPDRGVLNVELGTEYFKIQNPNENFQADIGSNAPLGLAYLQDGVQQYRLTAMYGDFIFDKALLCVVATDPTPEPATMLILGLGLIGTAVVYRRRIAKVTSG